MNWLLLAAAIVSFITWGLHFFVGGPTVARPLLAARDLEGVAKHTNYCCWHMVSILLLAMPLAFLRSALRPESRELALLMAVLAGAFTIWNLVLIVWKRQRPIDLPQWVLFLPITVLAVLGVLR